MVVAGRVASFATGEEREYPIGFCVEYANALKKFSEGLNSPVTFIEIFSGPNAPLSHAVAEAFKVQVPESLPTAVDEKIFSKKEASTRDELGSEPPKASSGELPESGGKIAESTPNRLHALEAGRQPSYGKRTQLIPDGLGSPESHFAKAKSLQHPFDTEFALKEDHKLSLGFVAGDAEEVVSYRLRQLAELKSLVKSSRTSQLLENRKASWTAEKLGLKVQTSAMRTLQKSHEIEDTAVPDLCLKGASILGVASESPFFEPMDVPPKMTLSEYHNNKRTRSLDMIRRVEKMARAGSSELACHIHEKTMKEVSKGTMGKPMTFEEVDAMFHGDFQVVPSFGLEQGLDELGRPKYRRIDDHSACGNNLVAHRKQKVPMCMVDYIGALIKALGRRCPKSAPLISTEDMKSAYRQVPLSTDCVRYSVTAVYDPSISMARLYLMHGQPFGAGHAVPNFCRVAEWMAKLLQRRYKCVTDHFFDDFWTVEPKNTIESAMFVLRETFRFLGFDLDPEKSQPPASVCAVLGVLFTTASLEEQSFFKVQAKPTRVTNLNLMIEKTLQRNSLPPATAASIVGKFGFLCSTLFGKVGRCCTGPLRQRQYSQYHHSELTPAIRASLMLMAEFLKFSPSRRISIKHDVPIILYTDASDVPFRVPQQIVGAVLYDPITETLEYTSWAVSRQVLDHWLPRSNHMGQLELLAAPFAALTWASLIENRSLICFIDNDSAASNLVKGYSAQPDSSNLVGEFWLIMDFLKRTCT